MNPVVLVHGAWHGPWCWEAVARELRVQDIPVTVVDLPFTGFEDDAAAARRSIEAAGSDVVVCAHSYGGIVVSQAASGLTNVERLVFLCALQADQGEDAFELLSTEPSLLLEALVIDEETVTVDPRRVHEVFYGDSDAELAEAIAPRLRPLPVGAGAPVVTVEPAWRAIPSTYVVCTNDRALSPGVQRVLARRAQEVVEWDCDHSPFLTRPRTVAELLASYC